METGIATLVCYAGVFGDVIGIEEMAGRLGASGQEEFFTAFNKLHHQGKIVAKDGFAGLPPLADKISLKPSKIETAGRLIDFRIKDLRRLGRNPIVGFVGISGSLAARNPTRARDNRLDLDVFLITRSQCLWLYVIPRSLRSLFPRTKIEPELCVNYIMDGSSLEIANKNFFTATEIRNLVPVSGMDAYRRLLHANRWVDRYYPGFSGLSGLPGPAAANQSGSLVNKSLYVAFLVLRSIKWGNTEPLRELSFTADPSSEVNFNRFNGCRYGGYQGQVHAKFARLAGEWFPDLLDPALVAQLFPDKISVGIRKGDIDVLKLNAATGPAALDFSKYG